MLELVMQLFKDKFLQLRKDSGLTQPQLAIELGVSKGVISFWEIGRSEPSAYMLKKIALFFDVSTDYLLGIEDEFGAKIKQ